MNTRTYQANPANNLSQQLLVQPSVFRPLVAWVSVEGEARSGAFHSFGLTAEQARDLAQQLLAIAAPEGAETTVTVGLRQATTTRVVVPATPAVVLRDPHRTNCSLRYNRAADRIEFKYDADAHWCNMDARSFTGTGGHRAVGATDIGYITPERRAIWDALIANSGTDEVTEVVVIDNTPEGVSGASFLKTGGVK